MTSRPLGDTARLAQLLASLSETIDARADAPSSKSYTAKLLAEGPLGCGKKIAEEGAELALALAAQGDDAVTSEAADLLYHLLVGLRSRGVTLDDVADALATRQGMSGLEEKARRPD